MTQDQAAHKYYKEQKTDNNAIYEAFKAGAKWQKEQDKNIMRSINGSQAWINDHKLKLHFSKVMSQFFND